MSTQEGPQSPRPIDPLLAAVAESVATGYQMLDQVIEGLRESMRLQAGSAARAPASSAGRTATVRSGRALSPATAGQRGTLRPAGVTPRRHRSAPGSPGPNPGGVAQDLAALVAEALGLAGTLVQDFVEAIGEHTHGLGDEECLEALTLSVPAGATRTMQLTVTNHGAALLRDVQLSATDLIGGSRHGPDTTVSFDPPTIARIPPQKDASVVISVAVAADAPPGVRRGVVATTAGDAGTLLELTITAAPAVAVQPVKPRARKRKPS